MAKVLVVYCSLSGNTEAAAQAVADATRSAGAEVVLKTASQAEPKDLQACDAVAVGATMPSATWAVRLRIFSTAASILHKTR